MLRYPTAPRSRLFTIARGLRQVPHLRGFSVAPARHGPLLNAIKYDHREFEAFLPHIVDHKTSDERTRYGNLFVWELARYSVAEEMVVCPAMEENLEDGYDVAKKHRHQIRTVRAH